jgi:uncharacterized membrane protein
MNTHTHNIEAWNNPNNWSRRTLFGLYFAKNDSRLLVPKAIPMLGWTLNLGHPAGAAMFIMLIAIAGAAVGASIATALV